MCLFSYTEVIHRYLIRNVFPIILLDSYLYSKISILICHLQRPKILVFLKAGKWKTHLIKFQIKIQLKTCYIYWHKLQYLVKLYRRGKDKPLHQNAKRWWPLFSPPVLWNVPYIGPRSLLDLLTVSQLRVWLHLLSIKLLYHWNRTE